MSRIRWVWKLAGAGLAASVVALLGACASGVSTSDYEALKQQLAGQEQKAAALQQQLSGLQQQLVAKDRQLTEAQQKPAAAAPASGVTTLIGARVVPTPAPQPTATPLPAGVKPAPKPTPPPSLFEPVPFAFYVETLATTSVSPYGLASTVPCTPNSVFKRGQKVVWRFEVIDTSTGKRLTDRDEPTIKVELPGGTQLTARFSQRAGGRVPDAPWMWSAAWDIPLDHPLGTLDYGISVATKSGRTGNFTMPALVSKDLGIDSHVKIID